MADQLLAHSGRYAGRRESEIRSSNFSHHLMEIVIIIVIVIILIIVILIVIIRIIVIIIKVIVQWPQRAPHAKLLLGHKGVNAF